jgi:hypothetical protein
MRALLRQTVRPVLTSHRRGWVIALACAIALAASPVSAVGAEAPPPPASRSAGLDVFEALKPGMPEARVRELLGRPEKVSPMKNPEGKAEIWEYTREVESRMEKLGFPGPDIVTYAVGTDGKPREVRTPGPLQFRDVRVVTEEKIELLLFEGQYQARRSSRREVQRHQ